MELFTNEELSTIENALQCYWVDACKNLERKDLGIIEERNYKLAQEKANLLMRKMDSVGFAENTSNKKLSEALLAMCEMWYGSPVNDQTESQVATYEASFSALKEYGNL